MNEKPEDLMIKNCYYCGVGKSEFENRSNSARGLFILYKPKTEGVEGTEKRIWFCSKVHADDWINQYQDTIEVIDDKTP